jgi:hypothetical protein
LEFPSDVARLPVRRRKSAGESYACGARIAATTAAFDTSKQH